MSLHSSLEADSTIPGGDQAGGTVPIQIMDSVVVSSTPLQRTLFDQAQPVSILSGEKLRLSLAPTLGETLSQTPGVRSSYYGPGASRPVIRGLDSDRIRILQNGSNTLDASATSVDHAVSFEPGNVESIEVVRGPATLLYGPNAIGGVVNVIDGRIPDERIDEPIRGSIGGNLSSADSGYGTNALLEGGIGGFAWHLEGYVREAEDLRIPGDARSARLRELQPLKAGTKEESGHLQNSDSKSHGFSAGASQIWDNGYFGAAYSGFETTYGSPAEKEVSIELEQRRWDFRGAFYEPLSLIKSINYRLAFSDYEHTEFEGPEPGTTFSNRGHDGRLEINHEKLGPFEGTLGYQNERSDFMAKGEEKFLPEVLTQTNSVFLFEEMEFSESLKLQGGARYDHISAEASKDAAFGPARERTFDNFSGSLGVVFTPNNDYSFGLSATYSERAPTYQELFANGPHVATGAFEVGDDSLDVEQALGLDLSLRKRTGRVTGAVTIFYNRFNNFIGQFPTGEEKSLEDEAFPVLAYRSTNAEFFGGEIEAIVHLIQPVKSAEAMVPSGKHPVAAIPTKPLHESLDLELKADYVRARDTKSGDPLPRISPFHASAALAYKLGDFGARVEGIFSASQHETADNELPTDSYCLLNAALTYQFKSGPVTTDVYIKGVNLTDEEAREHTSFLKDIAPLGGRGIVAGVKISF